MQGRYKKILFVIDVMRQGGAQKVLAVILKILCENKYTVGLVVLKRTSSLMSVCSDVGVHFILENENEALLSNSFKILDKATQIAKNYDLLVSFMDFITSYYVSLSAYLLKKPYYICVRCEPSFQARSFEYMLINNALYEVCLQNASKIICNSRSSCNDVARNYKVQTSKVFLLSNPIDIERIRQLSCVDNPTWQKFVVNKRENEIFCFMCGRLVEGKNYQVVFEAFRELGEANISLFILGSGEYGGVLENYKKQYRLDNIYFLGYQENIYSFLKWADIFIHASLSEGFPNAVLEAAALKKPLILSDIPPLREFFCEDREAVFFTANDSGALVDKIMELATNKNKREALAQEAFRSVSSYSLENFSKTLLKLFV